MAKIAATLHISPMQFDILALEGGSPGALAATVDVLETANQLGAQPAFEWRIVAEAARVALRAGLSADARPLGAAPPAEWVIVVGMGAAEPEAVAARLSRPDAQAAVRWLRGAGAAGARLGSACTGVFLLADAGLLDGRACTTSWWLQGLLARRAPRARVRADDMVVADPPVWTAGPAYAHLDMMLAVLAEAASPDLAQAVGRRLSAERRASQGPLFEPSGLGTDPALAAVEAAVSADLTRRVSLDELAAAAGLSARTLARRLQAETGLSPMRFVQKVRLEAALRLIRAGDLPLARVAERVGLADAAALHRLVVRHTRRAPGAFRAT